MFCLRVAVAALQPGGAACGWVSPLGRLLRTPPRDGRLWRAATLTLAGGGWT
jgi:hypothetical protein